jgi:hypothetical protein
MPRTCIDYSKSVVYRIVQNHTTHYIGSTTSFVKRKANHKSDCKNPKKKSFNFPLYKFIRANGGWDNGFEMVLIQEYPLCKNSLELEMYEREHYEAFQPNLNAKATYLTEEERKDYRLTYYNNNKAVFLKRSNDYYLNNKEHCKEKCRIYYLKNKANKA